MDYSILVVESVNPRMTQAVLRMKAVCLCWSTPKASQGLSSSDHSLFPSGYTVLTMVIQSTQFCIWQIIRASFLNASRLDRQPDNQPSQNPGYQNVQPVVIETPHRYLSFHYYCRESAGLPISTKQLSVLLFLILHYMWGAHLRKTHRNIFFVLIFSYGKAF